MVELASCTTLRLLNHSLEAACSCLLGSVGLGFGQSVVLWTVDDEIASDVIEASPTSEKRIINGRAFSIFGVRCGDVEGSDATDAEL